MSDQINDEKLKECLKSLSVSCNGLNVAELNKLNEKASALFSLLIQQRKLYEEQMALVGWST